MYNWIKKLSKTLMAAGLIILGSISVHAASSDAIMNQTMVNAALSRYGAAYESPFVVPPSGVDPSTGAVTGRTLELSLPGKNGLDLNLYRDYNSYDAFNAYCMKLVGSSKKYVYGIAVPYTGYIDGTHRTVYVMYPREEDIEASIQTKASLLQSPDTDIYGQEYFERTDLSDGTEVSLTWDKSQKPVHIDLYGDYIWRTANNSADVEIAGGLTGWNIYIPSISEMFSSCSTRDYDVEIETASGTKTVTYTTFFYEVTAEMGMEDGSKETIKYKYFYSNEDDIVHWQSAYVVSGVSEYDVNIEEDGVVEDPRGFKYNLRITNQEGKTYYYYLPNPINAAEGPITAIGNRFGDVILFDHLINGKYDIHSWRIIDTYGRTVLVRSSGITVNAGELTKQIDYRTSTQRDEVNNVSGGYETFDTHCLEVVEYSGNGAGGAEVKTTYKYKNKTLLGAYKNYFQKSARVIPVLDEVDYPTNARREYVYEETPSGPQYLFGYKSPGTINQAEYYAYRVIGEKLYENDELKSDAQYSYSGTWTQNALYGRVFASTETLENEKTKTTKYEYDMVGRIIKQDTQYYADKETNTERISYTYTRQVNDFSTDSERLKARRSSIQNISTTRNNKTISSVNSSYNRNKQPLLLQLGEKKTTNTYDSAYCLPLTQVSNRLDAPDLKQVNTLTADKKNIAKTEVYEGSALKNTTTYTYNSNGTVASQTVSNDGGNAVTNFTYQYNADGSYTVTATAQGIKNADGTVSNISTSTHIDPLGRKVSETDGKGNVTQYEYDMLGQVTKQINPDGTSQQIAYDVPNNRLSVTDENGNTVTRAFTPVGNLEKIYLDQDPTQLVGEYAYDKLGRKIRETSYMDIGGLAVSNEYTYDDFNRPVTVTSKSDDEVLDVATTAYEFAPEVMEVGWLDSNHPLKMDVTDYKKVQISATGECQLAAYQDGVLTQRDEKEYKQIIHMALDLSETEELTIRTTSSGQNITLRFLPNDSEINLLGGASQVVTTSYKGDEYYVKPTTVTTLDGYGNTVSEAYYKGTVAPENLLNKNVYQYDYQGNVLETLGGRTYMEKLGDYTAKVEYDYAGRPLKQYQADGGYTSTVYDKLGNAVSTTDFMGNTTSYQYDQLGRVLKTTAPFDGTYTSEALTYYDNNGNIVMTKQQNNKPGEAVSYAVTENEYDSRNRLVSTKANDGTRDIYTQYAYDNVGNMVKMVTGQTEKIADLFGALPEGVTYTTYEYDRFGNVTRATDSLGKSVTSEYNLMGLPVKQTDRNDIFTERLYNAYGSITSIDTDGEANTYYTYNKNNLLIAVSHLGSSPSIVNYRYDKYGFVDQESVRQKNSSEIISYYINDVNGNRKNFTQKDSESTVMSASYTYDQLDRPTKVSFGDGVSDVSYTYNANSQLLSETTTDNTASYTYNKAGLVTAMSNSKGPNYSYSYRLDGNQIQKVDSEKGTTEYTYDGLGQLKNETTTQGEESRSISYEYDSRGNRISMKNGGIISQYTYDTNNRLLTEISAVGPTEKKVNYSYDDNGNLIFKGTELYTDADGTEEEEISLNISGSGTAGSNIADAMAIHYSYNARGQLTNVQTDNGINASYAYDATGRRRAKTVNGTVTNQIWDGQNIVRETNGSGTEIAKYYRGSRLAAQKSGTAVSYYTYDAHGSVAAMNGQGYEYDAYGNLLENGVTSRNPFRYNGEYYDEETGMIYLRARYYDPSTGRFVSEDPIKDGLNWYAFCSNNPVTFVDSSGLVGKPLNDYSSATFLTAVRTAYDNQNLTEDNYIKDDAGNITDIIAEEGENSSITSIAAIKAILKIDAVIDIAFIDGVDEMRVGGNFYLTPDKKRGRLTVYTQEETDGIAYRLSDKEIVARIGHENTHGITRYHDFAAILLWHLNQAAKDTYDFEKGYGESTAMIIENMIRKELGIESRSYDAMASGYKVAFLPWEPQMDEGSSLKNKPLTKDGSFGLTYAQTSLIWVTLYRDAGML